VGGGSSPRPRREAGLTRVPSQARALALGVLLEVEGGGATLADLLAAPAIEALSRRDRALLHELVLGTLRHRGALDAALARVVDRPLSGLDRLALTALRLGAYQVLRTRIPPHAAVSESVELARGARSRAAGLVNAALRRLVREGPPPAPDPRADPLGWLTTEGSLPEWLAARWLRQLGAEAAVRRARAFLAVPPAPDPRADPLGWLTTEGSLPEWLAARWLRQLGAEAAVRRTRAFLAVPPATFRLNPRVGEAQAQVEAAGVAARALPVPGAWRATSGHAAPLASAGIIYLQDAGSQAAARLAARSGRVLDACAAPGGKSLLMADLAGDSGRVVGLEASPRRLRAFAELARGWGSGVLCLGGDALQPPFRVGFDAVLLDAPCTGLGTLGRHPDIRWRMREAEIARHADRQARLLESVSACVKPGGRLVYSVCSAEPEEGPGVVGPFLEGRPDFHPAPLPDWARSCSGPDGFLRTGPEQDGGDAFFVAALDRRC